MIPELSVWLGVLNERKGIAQHILRLTSKYNITTCFGFQNEPVRSSPVVSPPTPEPTSSDAPPPSKAAWGDGAKEK